MGFLSATHFLSGVRLDVYLYKPGYWVVGLGCRSGVSRGLFTCGQWVWGVWVRDVVFQANRSVLIVLK